LVIPFTQDGHKGEKVRYALMNPPFGVTGRRTKIHRKEAKELGFMADVGAGYSQGHLMDHCYSCRNAMLSKMP